KNTLTEDELVAQTELIMIAVQDTTAITLALGLLELFKAPESQDKLRAEIHSTVGGARVGSVAYERMALLDAFIEVCRTALKLYPAEPISDRIAVQDTIIPLTDSITTSGGERMPHILINCKGQIVFHVCRLQSRWGEDVHEFNTSRWLDARAYRERPLVLTRICQ
ncbi:cytochrome P450, partial [Mycena olivaceomarginata]